MNTKKFKWIIIYLFLVFFLSWGFDWLIVSIAGMDDFFILSANPWGMLVPAFVAIVLQRFFLPYSKIHYKKYKKKPVWIFRGFLILTVLYAAIVLISAVWMKLAPTLLKLGVLLFTLWTLTIFWVVGQTEKKAFREIGLSLGKVNTGEKFIIGIILFFILQMGLNLIFLLGNFPGRSDQIYGLPIPSWLYFPGLVVLFVVVGVIGLPLAGLAGFFGEEYGWRGFLLGELIGWGKLRAVVLIGLIWGIWHIPVILRGIHTYPPTLTGLVLGIIFFTLWGILQGYAVIKTGSIWIAAFMHGVVNSVYSFFITYVVKPEHKVFSFGLGIYGLLCLAFIVVMILFDPVWKKKKTPFMLVDKTIN